MPRFKGRKGDLTWGRYNYPVTQSQKDTLDGLEYLMRGLPRAHPANGDIPEGYFASQNLLDGGVIIGLHHNSVTVHRTGRITSNERMRVFHPLPSRIKT
jgi:hypothetical protein